MQQKQFNLPDLIRTTERIGSTNQRHCCVQKFSILDCLKANSFVNDLNSKNFSSSTVEEMNQLRLQWVGWRVWKWGDGALETLQFKWNNGIMTQSFGEKRCGNNRHYFQQKGAEESQEIRKIIVKYDPNVVFSVEFQDKDGKVMKCMGNNEKGTVGDEKKTEIELEEGEIIIGVEIQEIPSYEMDDPHKTYEEQEDKEAHTEAIGSIAFQLLKIPKLIKDLLSVHEMEELVIKTTWLAGENPYDFKNQFKFNNDKTFSSHDRSGKWEIDSGCIVLEFDNSTDKMKFEFQGFEKDGSIQLECIESVNEAMKSWKLASKPEGKIYRMSLKSHPEKALVQSGRVENHGGHDAYWFNVGELDKAQHVVIKEKKFGVFIKMADKIDHSFDCTMGRYYQGNEIVAYYNHEAGNQWFVVNEDLTISPTHSPDMVWGIIDEKLVLVNKGEEDKVLVFNELEPTIQDQTTISLKMTSHPGKSIALEGLQRQHGHGCEQLLSVGEENQAIDIFIDNENHIHLKNKPFQVLDGHINEPLRLFTKHYNYEHQKFTLTDEGTISFNLDSQYVLGTDQDAKQVMLVKNDSQYKFTFDFTPLKA